MAELVGSPRSRPRHRRRRLLVAAAVAFVGIVAAAGTWRWSRPMSPPPLEPDWEAVVTTRAGALGEGVLDGQPWAARLSEPFGVAIDADGAIYITDAGGAQRVRRVLLN